MLTVSTQSIVEGVLKRARVVPDDASPEDIEAILDSVADRYKFAHDYYRWPLFTNVEQRFFAAAWQSAPTYNPDDIVYYPSNDTYYVAIDTTTAFQAPPDTPAEWVELTDFNHQVNYEQAGETAIEAVIFAYDKDPRADSSARKLETTLRLDGVGFSPNVGVTSVWLEYRPRAANFTCTIYDEEAVYAAGAGIYFTDGEVYRCLEATTAGEDPADAPAKWELQEFPEFLASAVKSGCFADWQAADEKPDSAALAESKFTDLLDEQVWQITKLQGQTGRPNMAPLG